MPRSVRYFSIISKKSWIQFSEMRLKNSDALRPKINDSLPCCRIAVVDNLADKKFLKDFPERLDLDTNGAIHETLKPKITINTRNNQMKGKPLNKFNNQGFRIESIERRF